MKTLHLTSLMTIFALFMNQLTYCQQENVVTIHNQRDKTSVTVRIDDIFIPDILLDTGFDFEGIIIYNPSYRDSLDLTAAKMVTLGGAGSENAQSALMIDSVGFFIGNHYLKNQRVIVLLSDIFRGFPTNGIIGYSLFGHYAVEIDYDNNKLSLHDFDSFFPDQGYTAIPVYFKNNKIPWIDVSIVINDEEAVSISAYIDFADRDPLVILERPMMKFGLPEVSEKILIGTGLSGDVYGNAGKISKLIIGPFELTDLKVTIAPAEIRSKQENADAIIGCGALNRFNLIFDYHNKYLYIRPNSSFFETTPQQ